MYCAWGCDNVWRGVCDCLFLGASSGEIQPTCHLTTEIQLSDVLQLEVKHQTQLSMDLIIFVENVVKLGANMCFVFSYCCLLFLARRLWSCVSFLLVMQPFVEM